MIDFEVAGAKVLKKRFDVFSNRMKKRRATNAKAVILVDRWIQQNFNKEGEFVGGWEKLAKSTEEARRTGKKKRKGNKVLQDTGQLKSNWAHYWSHRFGRITSKVPYAKYHDSDKPRKSNLPRRQILPDNKHIEPKLEKLYQHFVTTEIIRSGLSI